MTNTRPLGIGPDQRKELEHLCRYITRPAIANERLKRNRAGQVVLQTEERVQRRHNPYRHVAAGIYAAPGRPGAPPALTSKSASMACSRRTQSCVVKSSPVRQSKQPRPHAITRRARRRA